MMMQPEHYVFTGRERVPRHVTHVLIAKSLKFVRSFAFQQHPNIEEVICHDGVIKIEKAAFCNCPRLRRVIMRDVKQVEKAAFGSCRALTDIECSKLEIIGEQAFCVCKSLSSIDLPSIKVVGLCAFHSCTNLINVKFGKDVESIGLGLVRGAVFYNCPSLEHITLPLKNGLITTGDIFTGCVKLNRVDLVEAEVLNETVSALLLEEWKNDMNEEIESIHRILPNAPAGLTERYVDNGEKADRIRRWIFVVRQKIIRYKAEHRHYLNEAAITLRCALPNDIVLKNVLPFLELPSYTFQGEDSE